MAPLLLAVVMLLGIERLDAAECYSLRRPVTIPYNVLYPVEGNSIRSPKFETGGLSPGEDFKWACEIMLLLPEKQTLQFNFTVFEQTNNPDCEKNNVTLLDESGNLIMSVCERNPGDFTYSGRNLTVKFESANSLDKFRFSLHYTALGQCLLPDQYMMTPEGYYYSERLVYDNVTFIYKCDTWNPWIQHKETRCVNGEWETPILDCNDCIITVPEGVPLFNKDKIYAPGDMLKNGEGVYLDCQAMGYDQEPKFFPCEWGSFRYYREIRCDPAKYRACLGSPLRISGPDGFVTSPGWRADGHGRYGDNLHCSWLITVPQPQRVNLTLDSYETERQYYCYYDDSLLIFDGPSKDSGVIDIICNEVRKNFLASTNQVLLIFKTNDYSSDKNGFKISFKGVP